jgi:hypothetical protein
MQKVDAREFPTWHEISPDTRIRLLRELAAAFKPGDGPGTPIENVIFQRACLYPIKQVARELGISETVM